MSKALIKHDYEILFKDSPEYFEVKNSRMIQEGNLIRFVCFDGEIYIGDTFFPIQNIHRIKRTIVQQY